MIDRIFSGAVTRGASHNKLAKAAAPANHGNANHAPSNGPGHAPASANHNGVAANTNPRMSYTEFVWFLISEEDKRHPTAIEYWFRSVHTILLPSFYQCYRFP